MTGHTVATKELPATITLCARFKDGCHCLGQIYNSSCIRCGDKNAGALYRLEGRDDMT